MLQSHNNYTVTIMSDRTSWAYITVGLTSTTAISKTHIFSNISVLSFDPYSLIHILFSQLIVPYHAVQFEKKSLERILRYKLA